MNIVDFGLIKRTHEIFSEYSKRRKKKKFLVQNKKHIKILVDAIWDQVITGFFSEHAKNYSDALGIINSKHLGDQSINDVVSALKLLLESYEVLDSKEYIDLRTDLEDFFINRLKPLLVVILNNNSILSSIGRAEVEGMIHMLNTL